MTCQNTTPIPTLRQKLTYNSVEGNDMQTNDEPMYWQELNKAWKSFFRLCMQIHYGELNDCDLENKRITKIRRIVKTHARPWDSKFVFDTAEPLPKGWVRLYKVCQDPKVRRIFIIKLSECEPSFFQIEHEGGWQYFEGG